jgi:O-antigen/teichoic acid export membrane protein
MTDKTIKYCTIVLLFWGLGMGFYAKEIIIMLFKENFVNSVLPLQILLVGTVIRGCIHVPIGGSLSGIGRPDLSLKISIFMITVNIILDVLLIPGFGIIGAAIATSISLILGAFINLYFVIKKMHIKIDIKWYLKLLILTFFFLVLFKYGIIFINAFLLGFIILFMYLILIFIIFLEQEDKDLFKLILNSFIIKKGS